MTDAKPLTHYQEQASLATWERMRERPILMSGPMVRATLEDRKTMTRRVVKSFKHFVPSEGRELDCIKDKDGLPSRLDMVPDNWDCCPYGVPGDRLWIKERHEFLMRYKNIRCLYRADMEERIVPAPYIPKVNKGRPSIHMPRWASRITLEITGVRVERLQEISDRDVEAEGWEISEPHHGNGGARWWYPGRTDKTFHSAQEAFAFGWDSINAKRAPWASNPFVWVVEFKRI